MSRKIELEIRTRVYPIGDNKIEVLLETVTPEGAVQKCTRSVMDTVEDQTRKALISLGWTPPAKLAETWKPTPGKLNMDQIDKRLIEIANLHTTCPMLCYRGDGELVVGGVVNLEQLKALVDVVGSAEK